MKTTKLILAALFTFGLGMTNLVKAQDDECNRFKAIAGNAYKVQDWEKVTTNYIKAQDECGSLEMVFYEPFIYAVKQSMERAGSEEAKAAYLDTLMSVYETAQATHGIQEKWQNDMGYNYLKIATPDAMKKADAAYQRGVHKDQEKVQKGYLQQYYLNIYNLWGAEKDATAKAEYKKRIISEYFVLSGYANRGDMGTSMIDFLNSILNNAVTDCESLLPEIRAFMKELPQEVEAKKLVVNNFLTLLEDKKCTSSEEYVMLVDTIIAIDPSPDAMVFKAKLQMSQGKTAAAIATFNQAKAISKDADQKSDIEYEIAKAYYNNKNFRAAHDAGIAVTGKNSAKGYEIAARSVNALMNDCGVSTFERKANNYYAVELAQKSGNANLISQMKAQCPTSSDIFNAVKSVGETVTLNCWGNRTVTIQTF